jgi:hypothetical protein
MDSLQKQPVPVVTFNDVERIARREFSDEQFSTVIDLLKEYGTEAWQRECPRVQPAALKQLMAAGKSCEPRSRQQNAIIETS